MQNSTFLLFSKYPLYFSLQGDFLSTTWLKYLKRYEQTQTTGNYFVTALVSGIFFGGEPADNSNLVVTCCYLKMPENSNTEFALLDENELEQLPNKWRNRDAMRSTKSGLIPRRPWRLNARGMLIWRSIRHLSLIKHYINFIENS